jgi:hypothetical protein
MTAAGRPTINREVAPKYHPTPLSGRDRKALKNELGHSRAMTGILAAQSDEMRTKGEALIRQADQLGCESWNERMWSAGEPIDPSPTIDQAVNGGYPDNPGFWSILSRKNAGNCYSQVLHTKTRRTQKPLILLGYQPPFLRWRRECPPDTTYLTLYFNTLYHENRIHPHRHPHITLLFPSATNRRRKPETNNSLKSENQSQFFVRPQDR